MLREFVERKIRRQIVRRSLLISTLAFAAIVVIWHAESLAGLAHPLRMFINNIHGGLTALAMQLSGGAVDSFTLSPAGGYTISFEGGADALTMSAGYLGSAMLGAAMFFLVNRAPHLIRLLSAATGLFTVAFLTLFIRPESTSDMLSMAICYGFGALLVFLGWSGKGDINKLGSLKSITQVVMTIVALMTGLHILLDLPHVLSAPASLETAAQLTITNPVAYFAETVMPSLTVNSIAIAWSGIAIALMGVAFYFGITRQLKRIPKDDDIV